MPLGHRPPKEGLRPAVDAGHRLVGGPQGVGDEAEVDEGRQVAVAVGNYRCGGGVPHHGHLEAHFQQLAQVGFHAQIGGHAGQDHLIDAVLAQLQNQIVLLRPIHLVGRSDDGFVVMDEFLVLGHEIRA